MPRGKKIVNSPELSCRMSYKVKKEIGQDNSEGTTD